MILLNKQKIIFNSRSRDSPKNNQGRHPLLNGVKRRNREKLKDLVHTSNRILYKTSSIFPFDFFPDDITVDESKINVVIREFIFSERIRSIKIETIGDILIDTNPFFATLKIIEKSYSENIITIKFLKKEEAIRIRRIIQGLVLAKDKGLDISAFHMPELIKKIEELGTAKEAE